MENERIENAQHEKGRKCTYWKMTKNKKSQPENERMENARNEKR